MLTVEVRGGRRDPCASSTAGTLQPASEAEGMRIAGQFPSVSKDWHLPSEGVGIPGAPSLSLGPAGSPGASSCV